MLMPQAAVFLVFIAAAAVARAGKTDEFWGVYLCVSTVLATTVRIC